MGALAQLGAFLTWKGYPSIHKNLFYSGINLGITIQSSSVRSTPGIPISRKEPR